jgi:signal transduction histidine kinase
MRGTVATATVALAAISVAAALAVVLLTRATERVSGELGNAIESVLLTEDAKIDLLLHARTRTPAARATIEEQLRHTLASAHAFVDTPAEDAILSEADDRVGRYLASWRAGAEPDPGDLDAAYAALGALDEMNVEQARAARREAGRWAHTASLFAVPVAAVLLAIVGVLLWWLERRAFRPVLALGDAMARFAGGDGRARAAADGPAELREMAERFNEMAEVLDRQRRAQMAFLAGVAHDLRTPLGALKLATGRFAPGRAAPSEDQVRQAAVLVARQVERLDRMVGDLLDVARAESGALELKTGEHDLRALAAESVDLLRATAPERALRLEAPDCPVTVRCDPVRIGQVLTNLLANALKYSPSGGEVEVVVAERAGAAEVSVSDRGVGISREEQQRIFEPFQRSRGAAASDIPGVGLGLFVTRRIVEAHGGSIAIESAEGLGSTFTVRLPAAGSPAPAFAEQGSVGAPPAW